MDYIALGKRVRKQRQAHHLTQKELAGQLGLSTSFLGHVERGTRKASLETLVAISNALHISVDTLLSDSLTRSLPESAADMKDKQRIVLRQLVRNITENWDDWIQEAPEDPEESAE